MISVKQVPINVTVPRDEIRVVTMQPYIRFPEDPEEPYRWRPDAIGTQLENIQQTLNVARQAFAGEGANFTLLPEYAVPGIHGATLIDDAICSGDWPSNSVIIAGVDGLPKLDYTNVCQSLSLQFSQGNAPDRVESDEWVNCCVIWVKDAQGKVLKWVQPKIRPAWPELNVSCNDMFCGQTVYVYEARYAPTGSMGYPCRFVTLICFDWVASVAGTTVCDDLLAGLSHGLHDPLPLHWAFVIQHNPAPNHPSFLNSSYRFLTDTTSFPFVERENAVIVHANTAVQTTPARDAKGAFSACVFSPSAHVDCQGCRPTVCMQPSALRASTILQRCRDVVFREMRECIHAFSIRIPKFISPDATDRTYPMTKAYVYPVGPSEDARLPGAAVPASVKWVNDSLDNMKRPSETALAGCQLRTQAEMAEKSIVASLRAYDGHAARDTVNWATSSFTEGKKSRDGKRGRNVDLWDSIETEALKHMVYSLTFLGIAYTMDCDSTVIHSCIETVNGLVQVIAVRGATHQDCRQHLDELVSKDLTDPILLISRDDENSTPTQDEYMRIDEIGGEGGMTFQDYSTLVETCRNATDNQQLRGTLDGILPGHRRII